MLDLNFLSEFSRTHCITMCAFLVPANLLTTLLTIILTLLGRPQIQVWRTALIANLFALVLVLHVLTWFMIGVVMPPTYILLFMASFCLGINLWAIAHPSTMIRLTRLVSSVASRVAKFNLPPSLTG